MWNLAPHDISIALHWLSSMPVSVNAKDYTYLQDGVEDEIEIIIQAEVQYFSELMETETITINFEGSINVELDVASFRLSDYSDPKIEVISAEKKNAKYTIVSSILLATHKKPEVKINWRVYTKDPDKPLIRDLIIEGLSLARTQKEEFSSIIESNNGDINALFSKLEEFVNI